MSDSNKITDTVTYHIILFLCSLFVSVSKPGLLYTSFSKISNGKGKIHTGFSEFQHYVIFIPKY